MLRVLELFCPVDDCCHTFEPHWQWHLLSEGTRRQRRGELRLRELLTMVIHFHQAHYRDFTAYSTQYVAVYLRADFPQRMSYQRFVEVLPPLVVPLTA